MHVPGDFTREEIQARAKITEQILDEVRSAHQKKPLDLFLSYFYNAHFDPAGFDALRNFGIPSVNFYCNSIYQFENVAEIARRADFSWHPERDARDLYLKVGANPVWVQMGADPEVYRPIPEIPRKRTACFVGQRYADRDRWLAALDIAAIPFDLYGQGWNSASIQAEIDTALLDVSYLGRKRTRVGTFGSYADAVRQNISSSGWFTGVARTLKQWRYRRETQALTRQTAAHAKGKANDVARTLAAYEVCLNFSNVWSDGRPGSALVRHVRLRDFEAPMCRTCYLTGHTDEIAEFYEVGKEIDTYRTTEELVDKTHFYLANAGAAERLRAAGYARARRDHTWVRRFGELFAKIGVPVPAPKHTTVSVAT